jgi:hypothetical protein
MAFTRHYGCAARLLAGWYATLPIASYSARAARHRCAFAIGSGLRSLEQRRELLLRFADVLGNDAREIHLVQLEAKLTRDQARDHRLAGARWSREQRRETKALTDLVREAPFLQHLASMAHTRNELDQHVELIDRENQIVPRLSSLDPLGQTL